MINVILLIDFEICCSFFNLQFLLCYLDRFLFSLETTFVMLYLDL